jgi:hypothetical protein
MLADSKDAIRRMRFPDRREQQQTDRSLLLCPSSVPPPVPEICIITHHYINGPSSECDEFNHFVTLYRSILWESTELTKHSTSSGTHMCKLKPLCIPACVCVLWRFPILIHNQKRVGGTQTCFLRVPYKEIRKIHPIINKK